MTGYNQLKSLVGFKASMSDWAAQDVTSAVSWMRERYKALPFAYVGHSFGGQVLGLLPNNSEISRALFIAAQAGYWKLMAAPERYRVYAMLNFAGIPLTRTLGYTPAWTGLGMDLPKDVFLQWVSWVMSPRYLFDDKNLKALENFPKYKGALRALVHVRRSLGDAAGGGVAVFRVYVDQARDHHGDTKGHRCRQNRPSRIFRPEHRDTLWRGAAEWIEGCRCNSRHVQSQLRAAPSLRAKRSNPSCGKASMDCFVASAPRNDGEASAIRHRRARRPGKLYLGVMRRRSQRGPDAMAMNAVKTALAAIDLSSIGMAQPAR